MASIILYKDINVPFDINRVTTLPNWTANGAVVADQYLTVSTSAHPSTALVGSALIASNYRELVVTLSKHGKLGSDSKYKSAACLNVDIIYTYIMNTKIYKEIHKVCLTSANCEVYVENDERHYTMHKYIKMPSVDAQSIIIKITNNTGGTITLKSVELKQSVDVNSGQIAGLTLFAPTLEYADRYNNGWSVKYRENDLPLNMTEHKDADNQFDGVNVNVGDALVFIPSRKYNEDL